MNRLPATAELVTFPLKMTALEFLHVVWFKTTEIIGPLCDDNSMINCSTFWSFDAVYRRDGWTGVLAAAYTAVA